MYVPGLALTVVHIATVTSVDETVSMQAKVYNTRGSFMARFPRESRNVTFKFVKHAPKPMKVELLKEMADFFAVGYQATTIAKFRYMSTPFLFLL